MVSFESDYINGAHPEILKRLMETNTESQPGYGADRFTYSAKEKIRQACGLETAEVEFLTGGTQTNAVVISTLLADHEGVVAAKTGHISAHEAGAIEYTGHEVLELPQENGKLRAEDLRRYLENYYADDSYEHMTFPGMVYISHPTEYGTLYTKAELTALSGICGEYGMRLFLDGARLGYGLMSDGTDVTLRDIAELCDVFYIGGTKVGALCGEAVVFTKGNRPKHFLTSVKRRGALIAKGRLLGVQFDTLFTDGLYFRISRHAIEMAEKMKRIFRDRGIRFFLDSPTNQQFVVLENDVMEKLGRKTAFSFWEKYHETHTVVRFATSWSTTDEDLAALEDALSDLG
ncbi:MAG: aminotransferase class I/II-fold pyridoxal phosphate-dependent enzyme [Lachnospiraceae bacterium]|nr:aminotransferase class I/II-fold pyridoxal phosphate-dependent enzyme [Lachnospiraceae bacterium]